MPHSADIIAPMSAERQGSRPFEDTKKAYGSAYETLVDRLLAEPDSPLSRKIAAEESRLSDHLRKMKDGRGTGSDAEGDSDVIAFNLGRHCVPVALPVNYRGRKGAPENRHNLAQRYLFGDQSLEEVGGSYGLTRERVRQQVKAATRAVLGAAPQADLQFETLNFRKPPSDRLRDKLSRARGGATVGIMEALKGGATYDELIAMGYNETQLSNARRRLAERQKPVDVPRLVEDWAPILAQLANPQTDRALACKLIKLVPRGVYQNHPEIFVDLSEVARGAGLYPRGSWKGISFMANYLELQKQPVGRAVYEVKSGRQKGLRHCFFTLRRCEEEIRQLLFSAEGPRFDKMRQAPIRVIGPKPEKMPNTIDLEGRRVKGVKIRQYSGVFDLLGPYGITGRRQLPSLKTNLEDLIGPNPPVSVFSLWNGFFVANVDKQALGLHLARRLQEVSPGLDPAAPQKM